MVHSQSTACAWKLVDLFYLSLPATMGRQREGGVQNEEGYSSPKGTEQWQRTICLSAIKNKTEETAVDITAEAGFLSRPVIHGSFPGCSCLGAIWSAEWAVPLHFLWGRPSGKPSVWSSRNNDLVVCPPVEVESCILISRSLNVRSGRAGLLVALYLMRYSHYFAFGWSCGISQKMAFLIGGSANGDTHPHEA